VPPLAPGVAEGTPIDPRAALCELAGRLEGAHKADPGNAAVARVLKEVLLALGASSGPPEAADDPLAAILALGDVS
jgi:hypothetical protein